MRRAEIDLRANSASLADAYLALRASFAAAKRER
jgi:hypothetical protein